MPKILPAHICAVCKGEIKIAIFKNTGVCCELHRKVRDGEITKEQADVHAVQ